MASAKAIENANNLACAVRMLRDVQVPGLSTESIAAVETLSHWQLCAIIVIARVAGGFDKRSGFVVFRDKVATAIIQAVERGTFGRTTVHEFADDLSKLKVAGGSYVSVGQLLHTIGWAMCILRPQ